MCAATSRAGVILFGTPCLGVPVLLPAPTSPQPGPAPGPGGHSALFTALRYSEHVVLHQHW